MKQRRKKGIKHTHKLILTMDAVIYWDFFFRLFYGIASVLLQINI